MCSVGGPAPGRAMEVEVHSQTGGSLEGRPSFSISEQTPSDVWSPISDLCSIS